MDYNIVVFQLVTGDSGIGRLDQKEEKILKAAKIVEIAQEVEGKRVSGVTIIPFFFPFSRRFPDIELYNVTVYAKAIPELASQYIEATSGIKLATQKDLQKIPKIN